MNWISSWWQQVSATVAQGLGITVVGMALVFVTLGLIILALVLLTRLPGLRAREESKESKPQQSKSLPADAAQGARQALGGVSLRAGRQGPEPRLAANTVR